MIIYFPTPKIKLLHRGKWTHDANRPPGGSAGGNPVVPSAASPTNVVNFAAAFGLEVGRPASSRAGGEPYRRPAAPRSLTCPLPPDHPRRGLAPRRRGFAAGVQSRRGAGAFAFALAARSASAASAFASARASFGLSHARALPGNISK